ncbi:MAG TPA: penicillin-binding protein [Anaerolineae bacterium]|nr:penicillin-binding protein [Anaerolineae bacterium]
MSSITERVDALFAKWDNPDSPGCVLAVIRNGEFVHKRGYGMADLERRVPITPDSVFDIGSTGKQFTATVIAILANQGQISLDDSIRKHLPEMLSYADQISIRHLIHHTSGLRDYLTLMDVQGMNDVNFYPEDSLYDLVARQKGLNYKPGREFLYSNTGYFLLGRIAQRVTGKHITQLIKEHILDPLGMVNTTFNKDHRPIIKDRALSYDAGDKEGTFDNAIALCGGYGDGAIITNIHDLLLWDHNFYDNKLNNAQPDLIDQLHTTGKLNNGKSISYAFGLILDKYQGQRIVSHGGSWAGYRTEMMRFPDHRFTVVCISNLGSINPTRLSQQVADIYLEDKIKHLSAKKLILSGTDMAHFTGIYQGKYLTVEIVIKDKEGGLFLITGTREYCLRQIEKKKFQTEEGLDTLTFSGGNNEFLRFTEDGMQSEKYKRIRAVRLEEPHLTTYHGGYVCRELELRYKIIIQDGGLQIKRNAYDTPGLTTILTEDTILCDFGELRFKFKDGNVKGFSLNADRVINLKFHKIQ